MKQQGMHVFFRKDLSAIQRLGEELDAADVVVIGAGAGLSTSAGFTYAGERFQKYFSDFGEKYGFHDMYTGGFYPYQTLEEHWAYWSRYIYVNRYMDAPKPVYKELRFDVKGKDYFVITTNVDHCFQKAGFDKKRLFYTQGDYGLFQCSAPCCQETFENEEVIRKMMECQKDMRIPEEILPVCPHCGKPMTMNLRSDGRFVQDEGWYRAAEGYNTPVIIKYPFWQMTAENPKAIYACINDGEAAGPKEIERQAIYINGDIGEVLTGVNRRTGGSTRGQG